MLIEFIKSLQQTENKPIILTLEYEKNSQTNSLKLNKYFETIIGKHACSNEKMCMQQSYQSAGLDMNINKIGIKGQIFAVLCKLICKANLII